MWPFGPPKLTPAEAEKLEKRCAKYTHAWQVCLSANAPEGCKWLEAKSVECRAAEPCPREVEAFQKCFTGLLNTSSGAYGDPAKCDGAVDAMRRCAKRKGYWPPPKK